MSESAAVVRGFEQASRVAGVAVFCVGLLSFAGWVADVHALKEALTGGITIKANAAVGLMLLGSGLLLLRPHAGRWPTAAGRLAAAVAATVGGLTFAQHVVPGLDFGIDQLLFKEEPGAVATASPGRMGPPGSLSYLLAGVALLLLDVRPGVRGAPAQWLALAVGVIALLPLIGYAYGIQSLYGVARYTGIAFHTALMIEVLALGILAARPTRGPMAIVVADDAGGAMARRLLVPAILIPLSFGYVRTIGERAGWFDASLGRPLLVLSLIVSFTSLVWWNAAALSRLGRARAEAEAERERLAALVRASRDAMIGVDTQGLVRTWSPGAEHLFGYAAEEMVGRPVSVLAPPEAREAARAALAQSLAGQTVPEMETVRLRKDGTPVPVSVSIDPVFDAAGRVTGVAGLIRDVTERHLAAEALRAQKEAAEAASRAKDEFLATLSHELRTPLTPVLLTVSLMESNPDLSPELRADVAAIRRNVELESRLIGDLLDLTRIEKGKLRLDEHDVDVHLVVRSAVDICQREAAARVEVRLSAQRHVVRGDATRLQQVFWNLVNNAIKFTDGDGVVMVRSENVDGRVRVEVADTGAGIDPSVMPRLFTPFEQGEVRATRQQAGLGLGLAISKKLVDMHGGRIEARSDGRGRGATFAVELPALEQAGTRAALSPPPPRATTRALSVLLVEDHEMTLRVMTRLLRGMGHRVTAVTSAASAIAAARQGGFDLMICDLGLPDGSGLDVMREVRATLSGRAIALTGYGMEGDVAASREAGFAEHLIKPVDVTAVAAAIARVAGNGQAKNAGSHAAP